MLRFRLTVLATLALAATLPAAAQAAPGALSPAGCVSQTGSGGACLDGSGLLGADHVAVSPDGRQVYAAAGGSNAVVVLARNPATGATAPASCVSETGGECADGKALANAGSVAVSPDGRSVYVASPGSDAVAVFARNATTGALTQLSGAAGCVSETGTGGQCADGRALAGASSVTVSPDGKHVYVASSSGGSDAVAAFVRDTGNGALTQLSGTAGCVSEATPGCATGRALGATSISVAPDGRTVYTTSAADDAVAALARNSGSGALSQASGATGCVSETGTGGQCGDGKALDGASSVTVAPDSGAAYVTSSVSDAVAVFARNGTSGALGQLSGAAGCVSETGSGGACADGKGLDGASGVALTRDGSFAYVASAGSSAVAAFAVSETSGALGQLGGTDACISETGTGGQCRDGIALAGASGVAASSNGRSVYAASAGANAVTGLARETSAPPAGQASGDFDGDGRVDVAIGVPGETVGSDSGTGAVHVVYGSPAGLSSSRDRLLHQDSAGVAGTGEDGDHFGAAVATGDFDGDGFDDLAVGAPDENVGRHRNSGAVTILRGSPNGLTGTGSRLIAQGSGGVGGRAESGDGFGDALAVGDLNGDRLADLAAGAPGEGVGRSSGAGAVNVLYGSGSGLSGANDQVVTQNSAGIGGVAERGDSLGDSVATGDFNGDNRDDLAAGAPSEDVGRHRGAGGVNVVYGSASGLTSARDQVLTQNTAGVPGAAESADGLGRRLAAGDLNGDGAAELVAGAPEENLGRDVNAGGFHVLVGSTSGLVTSGSRFITQDSRGVQGSAERGDRLANALAVGDFNGDGRGDLAAGAPGEGIGRARAAGLVHAFYGTAAGLSVSGDQLWTQNSAGIQGRAERDDAFGDALGTADGDGDERTDLVAGAPGEQVGRARGAGSVNVVYGAAGGLAADRNQLFTQSAAGFDGVSERGDEFGGSATKGGR